MLNVFLIKVRVEKKFDKFFLYLYRFIVDGKLVCFLFLCYFCFDYIIFFSFIIEMLILIIGWNFFVYGSKFL